VSPLAAHHIKDHLASLGFSPGQVKRFWLHQANVNMNNMVIRHLFGEKNRVDIDAPIIIDHYANTASAGVIIAFDAYSADLEKDDIGIICSFGAGYSIGSLVLRKR
jgi:beta-ketodecanoyl-[acyl-carrier-protein] synthase